MTERRAVGAPVIQVERELDVRPDQLAHERSMRAGRAGQGPPCEGSSLTRKCASCGARSRCCGRSRPSQKVAGVLRKRVTLRYTVITRYRREFQVRFMCQVLEVTPSGYYAFAQAPAKLARADRRSPAWRTYRSRTKQAAKRTGRPTGTASCRRRDCLPARTGLRGSCETTNWWHARASGLVCPRPIQTMTSRSRQIRLCDNSM